MKNGRGGVLLLSALTAFAVLLVFVFALTRERRALAETETWRWFATSTEEDLRETLEQEEEYAIPDTTTLPEEATAASSSAPSFPLMRPAVERLLRIASDPVLSYGERGARVPVFIYHHIRPFSRRMNAKQRLFTVTTESFAAQMEGLTRAGFTTITPEDLLAAMDGGAELPPKPVMITFDDSYRDQYEYAYPVLKRFGMKASFFVVTQSSRQRGAMTQEMIRELDQSGVGFIASHTQHHAYLTRYKKETRLREIGASKKDLEVLLGHRVDAFAYPYGAWNEEVEQEVRDAGYKMAFGVRLGSLHASSSLFNLRRIGVYDREDVAALAEAMLKK